MNEKQLQLFNLMQKLGSQDYFAKGRTCDEIMTLIDEKDTNENKSILCQVVVPHLVDLNRKNDFDKCIDILLSNPDYHFQLFAKDFSYIWCYKQNDMESCVSMCSEAIDIAEHYTDSQASAIFYLYRGKAYLHKNEISLAFDDFCKTTSLAEESHNFHLLAISKYYIGLALFEQGHKSLGLEKFREASELAVDQHDKFICMHTETVRALMMLEDGKIEHAKKILSDFFTIFKTEL